MFNNSTQTDFFIRIIITNRKQKKKLSVLMTLNHSSVPIGTADTNIYTHGKSLRTNEKETLGNKTLDEKMRLFLKY